MPTREWLQGVTKLSFHELGQTEEDRDWPKKSDRREDSSNIISSFLEVVIVMWIKTGQISFTSFCRVLALKVPIEKYMQKNKQ